jgi:RNA polymerase sigma-70 factor (ECF subfamily)
MKTTGTRRPDTSGLSDSADLAAFDRLVGPYRRELKAYCYRMLGTEHEAEDLVQETFLRAWRGLDRFEGRGSVRGWLYRIATNACLTAIAGRASPHRVLPDRQGPPSSGLPQGQPDSETSWLEPYPDSELEGIPDRAAGPAARYELGESVRLVFVAAIQQLPARQRAVLLLCDVLGWSANEAALLLGGSIASANSALQRARVTLGKHHSQEPPPIRSPPNVRQRELLDRYVRAWEQADLDGFVDLLRKDATYRMPPWSQWYQGRDSIREFFRIVWKSYGSFRLIPTSANQQPAFGVYTRGKAEADWRPHSLQLLDLDEDSIASLTKFMAPLGPQMFQSFGLPLTVSQNPGPNTSVRVTGSDV